MARKGLGSGLEALFGEDLPEEDSRKTVPISKVEPRPGQPRITFDEEALQELADSIKQYGVLQPITVRELDNGYYQIIAGERRWRASRLAGIAEVPVNILSADDRMAAELALVENLQREDLNPVEEAKGYRQLMDDYGLTQEEAAKAVGKSRPAVENSLRLLSLEDKILTMISDGLLTAGHARSLIPLQDKEKQLSAAEDIVKKKLSVRQTEQLVSKLQSGKKQKEVKEEESTAYAKEV